MQGDAATTTKKRIQNQFHSTSHNLAIIFPAPLLNLFCSAVLMTAPSFALFIKPCSKHMFRPMCVILR